MPASSTKGRRYTAFHWGTYEVQRGSGNSFCLAPLEDDPDPSPIGPSLVAGLQDPCRIRQPHVRKGWLEGRRAGDSRAGGRGSDPFVPVSWNDALDLVAAELRETAARYGNSAIFAGSYGWGSAGRFHHPQSQLHRFMNCFGGYTSSVNAYSFAAAEVIVPHVVGHKLRPLHAMQTPWPVLAEHVELFVSFGGVALKNTQVSPGVAGPHIVPGALARCAERGASFINIGPIRDDLPDMVEAEWLAIRPNTDVALMLALASVLIEADLCDRAFLESHTEGFAEFERYLRGDIDGIAKTPEWAARIVDVEPDTIRALARRMAEKRTFISLSWSIQRGDHGEQPIWTGIALAAMLGQIGTPGGGFGIGYGGCNYISNPARKIPWASLPQGFNPVSDFIPVARISDLLLRPGETFDYDGKRYSYPDIRLVYWAGGNPFHHHQDINRLLEAWRRPQTIIVNELWWNASARHADIVLPVTSPVERNDIAALSGEAVVVAMRQAMPPVGGARNDYDIFSGLALRLGILDTFTEGRDEMAWLRAMYAQSRDAALREGVAMPDFETFWEEGIFRLPDATADRSPLFEDFRKNPELHPLPTPSGKIEITSRTIAAFEYDDCPAHPAWLEPAEWLGSPGSQSYPLHMISNQPASRLHSQHDHAALSRKTKVKGREQITLHPRAAASRGISQGDVVRVFNSRGACLCAANLSDAIRPDVVQLATGAWYDPLQPGEIGSLDCHGNPNVLTLDKGTSSLGQAPSATTVLVQIERYAGMSPPVKIFTPPPISD
ncbi:MAG: Asp-tRNA(Asn)/Glu-tRNA(Gln) amidotransferase GatCAB subunit C [Bradyrhizobiaceae bacterium]|nr:MAG: Asp-tRNA(Asn)/Glu-tRNA(Gln) amidotransferase GatCAB subunit C [Bradyrhizobiaceae bacterium]